MTPDEAKHVLTLLEETKACQAQLRERFATQDAAYQHFLTVHAPVLERAAIEALGGNIIPLRQRSK